MPATLEQGLVTFLTADPAVQALIGTRIGPWKGQLDLAAPAITYELVGQDDVFTLAGCSDEPTAKLTLKCFGVSMQQARSLAYLAKNSKGGGTGSRLKELGGNGRPAMLGTVTVAASMIENESDGESPPVGAEMPEIPCVQFDLSISYLEP
jgi:hypothetical protein